MADYDGQTTITSDVLFGTKKPLIVGAINGGNKRKSTNIIISHGGYKMNEKVAFEIINNLKNEARTLYEIYAVDRDNEIAQAIHKIMDAINILERKAYGQVTTTVYDLK